MGQYLGLPWRRRFADADKAVNDEAIAAALDAGRATLVVESDDTGEPVYRLFP